ncbi:MAG: hypothetical protein LC108_02165 [Anaerolineales bacterium]|nr:hypothetical protein [Anaerolineales bacterium]
MKLINDLELTRLYLAISYWLNGKQSANVKRRRSKSWRINGADSPDWKPNNKPNNQRRRDYMQDKMDRIDAANEAEYNRVQSVLAERELERQQTYDRFRQGEWADSPTPLAE